MNYCDEIIKSSLILLSLCQTISSHADTPYEKSTRYYRHELSVSIGGVDVRSGWSDDYENTVMNRFGLVVGKGGTNGVVYQSYGEPDLNNDNILKAISYYYHFNHQIAVGGLFGGCHVYDWLGYPEVYKPGEIQKTGYTDVKGTSLFLMPSVKWSYLNNRWCSLYMKASMGIHYQSLYLDSESIASELTDEYSKKHISFAYNVIPFGWEIGKRNIRWFIELGFSPKTNFQTGIVIRFGAY